MVSDQLVSDGTCCIYTIMIYTHIYTVYKAGFELRFAESCVFYLVQEAEL